MTSKFSRNPATTSAPAAAPAAAPEPAAPPARPASSTAAAPPVTGELSTQFAALQAKASALRERRVRLTVQQEHVQREIEACQAQARDLGVASLEELEQLVTKMEEEERRKLGEYSKALEEEEARLSQVEGDLSRLDQRG